MNEFIEMKKKAKVLGINTYRMKKDVMKAAIAEAEGKSVEVEEVIEEKVEEKPVVTDSRSASDKRIKNCLGNKCIYDIRYETDLVNCEKYKQTGRNKCKVFNW